MCGLVSIFAYSTDAPLVRREELLKIRDQMIRRGPDGFGDWISSDGRIGLGHRRLSIIDTSEAGLQPMASVDGQTFIVFNGEIYNYLELRQQLVAKGHQFRSQTDTEVLLVGWLEWGESIVSKIRGMYAFAIWDGRRKGLFIARDPFGIKPLYIADDGKTLRIASQVKALLAGGNIDTRPDPAGHAGFFVWGSVPEPHTLYKGIKAFPPGRACWISSDGHKKSLQFANINDLIASAEAVSETWAPNEITERLRAAVTDSVRRHLVADVPVGIFLSSGIDSCVIASIAKQVNNSPIHTLTLGFHEYKGKVLDETPLAEKMAKELGTLHRTSWITKDSFDQDYKTFIESMDQPTIDGLNTWYVCKAAKEAGLTVALSGMGGDEFFGGYESFHQIPKAVHRLGHLKPLSKNVGVALRMLTAPLFGQATSNKYAGLLEYGSTYCGAYLLRRAVYMPWEIKGLLPPELVEVGLPVLLDEFSNKNPSQLTSSFGKVSSLESSLYLRNQLLRDSDWASMAHGIELRVPLIDLEVLSVCARARKMDLANTPRQQLPSWILKREKTGFAVPIHEWIKGDKQFKNGRGLKGWARHIYARFRDEYSGVVNSHANQKVILWAPEMASAGGIQSYMWRLWEMLDATYFYRPIGLSLNDSNKNILGWDDQYTALPKGASGWKVLFVLKTVSKTFRESLLIVGHLHLGPLAWLLMKLGLIEKYIVVLHGIEAWKRASFLQRIALKDAASVIATTKYTAETCAAINSISGSNFKVIPLCVETHKRIPDSTFKLSGEFPVLFVGRLSTTERYKGVELLIRAISALRANRVPIKLHIVGDGDDRYRIEMMVNSMNISEDVVFHGYLDNSQLTSAYRTASVFAMPSQKEGFGIVFLEAMRHGVPCIGGNHGGTPEVIRDGIDGYLVNYGDVEELTQKLSDLWEDKSLRERMGRAAQLRHEDFLFDSFKDRWRQLYETV